MHRIVAGLVVLVFAVSGLVHAQPWRSVADSGNALFRAGKTARAVDVYMRALVGAGNIETRDSLYEKILDRTAMFLLNNGKAREAEEYSFRLLRYREKVLGPATLSTVSAVNAYALSCYYTGKYAEAEDGYTRALDWTRANLGESHPDYLSTLSNLSLLHYMTGRYSLAEQSLTRVMELEKNLFGENDINYINDMSNLSLLCMKIGRTREAEDYSTRSIALGRKVLGGAHPDLATAINNAALLAAELGRPRQAEEYLRESMAIREKSSGRASMDYAQSLNNLAYFLEQNEDYPRADSLFTVASVTVRALLGERCIEYASILHNRGRIAFVREDHALADTMFRAALRIKTDVLGVSHPECAVTLFSLALLQWKKGKRPEALEMLKEVHDIQNRAITPMHVDYVRTVFALAELHLEMDQFVPAEDYFRRAMDGAIKRTRMVFPGLSEKEKFEFVTTVQGNLHSWFRFCYNMLDGSPQLGREMLDKAITTRGMILHSTQSMKKASMYSGDSTLAASYRSWLAMREQLARLYALPYETIRRQRISIDSLEDLSNVLEKRLVAASELFSMQQERLALDAEGCRRLLRQGEALVHIVNVRLHPDTLSYLAIIIPADQRADIRVARLGDEHVLDRLGLAAYRGSIRDRRAPVSGHRSTAGERTAAARDSLLYTLFWKPIRDALGEHRVLYLVPDGVFASVNLLAIRNPTSGRYLIDEADVRILEHENDLIASHRNGRTAGSGEALLIGDPDFGLPPEQLRSAFGDDEESGSSVSSTLSMREVNSISDLPGTRAEIKNIGALLRKARWNVRSFIGKEARSGVLRENPNPELVHIATHGYFIRNAPARPNDRVMGVIAGKARENPLLRGGLLFAGARNIHTQTSDSVQMHADKAIMTAYEASNLSLMNTELVVLSACETGLGEVRNGEGVMGLQRAFRIAGARCIVMSLWSVPDKATQELMRAMYASWLKTGNLVQSLRAAQRSVMRKYPHPFYWGAFIVSGSRD